ncbi:MAG: prolyl oligopeptidase family serine peptidase [Cyanobacteriota bacterium]|nr:prolyl oligopeptidase family serine peptidase [Cyanobacteriota bacterium]
MASDQGASPPRLTYPLSQQGDQVDVYHGIAVADPYRWLEDPDTPATRAWIAAQNQVTFAYLESIPQRQSIGERLTHLWNYEKYSAPFREGNCYFYFKNDGLQNQSVLYTLNHLDDTPRVLLDPNLLSADGTVALSGIAISPDGQWLAYGLSHAGSDWQEWRVREIATGVDGSDHLQWIKFSGASWRQDQQGFFYSRYDPPHPQAQFEQVNYYQKLFYHRLGTAQSDDILIYERPDQKEWGFQGEVTEDGSYLIISVWRGTDPKNLLFYKDLRDPNSPVVELISEFEAEYRFVEHEGSRFWLVTDWQAPRKRLIAIDITHPDKEHWQEIIPQAQETLESISLIHDQFVVFYLQDAHTQIQIYDRDGCYQRTFPLPGLGSAGGFVGKRHDHETFFTFTSFVVPPTIYHYHFLTDQITVFRQPQLEVDASQYEVKQVFYSSRDGTSIPMFITHKKGIPLDGRHPTYLYGYGGFGVSLTPSFSISLLVWLEMGGVYAVPNLRGGGEYGEEWHQAGTTIHKQRVFDDFIAAAEWLIAAGYTSSKKLAMAGGSNGGLLVGACMTQRPDLFAAALPAVGVMDMLRFDQFTIGWAWISEYGNPADPEQFHALYAYSPLHNLKPGTAYPATLITTADHDDRVVPAHSFKFAAALQQAHQGASPVLIRIETQAGHGSGKPTQKVIEEAADRWAFLVNVLQMS